MTLGAMFEFLRLLYPEGLSPSNYYRFQLIDANYFAKWCRVHGI